MKRSAGSLSPDRGSFTVNSNMQNVTVQTELYRMGDDLDTVTLPEDHRLPPIQRSANESSPARQSGVAPGFAAAAIFISFLLALYAVLWKCMSSKVR
ncbi:uncharacterized protein sb:cb288, partial [Chiloscyllium plagiosum]|uniref:uncharacterized protein sb:cb288 n=1 Tax=Chiloscyllium plagiosum TaxID=36176 RepID=UPI001CB81ED2